jgi:hypothetical protein
MRILPTRSDVVGFVIVWTCITLFLAFGPPWFWGDFTGMTEAEARKRLGEPFWDTRGRGGDRDGQEFKLGWIYIPFLEAGFFLDFKNGVVVSQGVYAR